MYMFIAVIYHNCRINQCLYPHTASTRGGAITLFISVTQHRLATVTPSGSVSLRGCTTNWTTVLSRRLVPSAA